MAKSKVKKKLEPKKTAKSVDNKPTEKIETKEEEVVVVQSEEIKPEKEAEKKSGRELRPTGIGELDEMLGGGLPSKATVLLSGGAGVGKTTLAMQWLFEGYAKHKETGVYITLTEPTTVAMQNLKGNTFYNKDFVASSDVNASGVESEIASKPGIHFVDLRQILEEMNLLKTEYTYKDIDKIHEVIFKMIMNASVSRVVIDSITAMAYLLKEKTLIRTFIYKMGKFLALSNANTLLIGEANGDRASVFGVEEFISDGVIQLKYTDDELFPTRKLKILKMRGIDFNSRPTIYRITDEGIRLFPKQSKALTYEVSSERVPTGVEGFDGLVEGGLIAKSAVLVSGPSGGGKTLFSLQTMVTNLKSGKKCMYVSHEESRDQLVRNAKTFGWDLEKYEKEGLLKIESIHPEKMHLAELISTTRLVAESFEPTLVIVDSLTALENLYEENIVHDWVSQLITVFKNKGILTLFLSATTSLVGESVASNAGISSLFDQIIMMRFVEIDAEFHHAILVVKMRGSKHDKKMYGFVFGEKGLRITNSFSGYEGIFSGVAKQVSRSKEEQIREVFMEVMGPMGEETFEEQKNKGLSVENINIMVRELADSGILDIAKEELFLNKVMKIFQGEK